MVEGRLENIKAKYKPNQSRFIDYLSQHDPSGNNKYLEWLSKHMLYTKSDLIEMGYDPEDNDSYGLNRMTNRWKTNPDEAIVAVRYFHENPQKFDIKDINR